MQVGDFYDELAPFYHLIFGDWEAGIERQAERLANVISDTWAGQIRSILDVSCGIGTQAIGLARKGFAVTASDLSPKAIERARREADSRGLSIAFSVCDMRKAQKHHTAQYDLVICCDNSITHLLSDDDILLALQQIYACIRPGGGCLITVRDYDKEDRGKGIVKPYGIREKSGKRYLLFQVWDFEDDQYDLSFYIIEDDRTNGIADTHVMRSRYYAVSPNRILELMRKAGFNSVARVESDFYQPILVGTRND